LETFLTSELTLVDAPVTLVDASLTIGFDVLIVDLVSESGDLPPMGDNEEAQGDWRQGDDQFELALHQAGEPDLGATWVCTNNVPSPHMLSLIRRGWQTVAGAGPGRACR
jgi:hypothetical protein